MNVDLLIVQLAIVFLPGLIWARLDARYAMKQKPGESELLLRALMYGLTAYAVVFLIYPILGQPFSSIAEQGGLSPALALGQFADEILVSVPVALVLATLWVAAANRKWLTRLLQWVGATRRYGDEDVWDFTSNSTSALVEYAHVRDFGKSIVYTGYVQTFSETGKLVPPRFDHGGRFPCFLEDRIAAERHQARAHGEMSEEGRSSSRALDTARPRCGSAGKHV